MKSPYFTPYFANEVKIEKDSPTPIYHQLFLAILKGIRQKKLKQGEILPSLQQLSTYFNVGKGTIEKAFTDLRTMGVVASARGRGFFINNTDDLTRIKILLFFDDMSAYNCEVYRSLTEMLDDEVLVDCFIYRSEERLLRLFREKRQDDYTHYVIMPSLLANENIISALNRLLPTNKLLFLDQLFDKINLMYGVSERVGNPV